MSQLHEQSGDREPYESSLRLEILAYLSVGGQFVEKPVVESDMLEYDQTLSFFAAVLRTDVVSSLEEKSRQVHA